MMTDDLPLAVLEIWQHTSPQQACPVVLPDGCRDLIIRVVPEGEAICFVSALSDKAYTVESVAGERFVGYRFRPGTRLDEVRLLRQVQAVVSDTQALADLMVDPAGGLEWVDQWAVWDRRVDEAPLSVSAAPTVASAALGLGVSERTLERLLRQVTGRTPGYWKGLARVRRAAAALSGEVSLAELAADHGYADQAHMSRAFQQWFGVSPSRFRADANLLETVRQSGY